MQNISNDVLTVLESNGLVLSFDVEKGLKVIPKEKITNDWRAFILGHKDQIIARLKERDKLHEIPVEESKPNVQARDRWNKRRPSPVALAWLFEHRQALLSSGWTLGELFSRKRTSRSIAFLGLWDEAFSMAYLHDDGTIEWECSIHGRDYFQTAKPRSMAAFSSQKN